MADRISNVTGITEIYAIEQSRITKDVALYAKSGTPVILPMTRKQVQFFGVPVLYSKSNTELNGEVCEAKLSFRSNQDIIPFGYVYAVKAADGRSFLIGTDNVQPTVDRSDTTGTPGGDPAVYAYEITMRDVITPILCIL